MTLRKTLLAATILALPVAAQAQPVTGLYVGAGIGANYREDTGREPTGGGVSVRNRTSWGYAALASIGWGFGNGLRIEVEGNFRENDVDRVTITGHGPTHNVGGSTFNRSGYVYSYGIMANAIYEFARFGWPVQPYLGGGIGYAWHQYDRVGGRVNLFSPVTGLRNGFADVRTDDTDGAFAFQAIGGLAIPIPAVPGLAITAEYRFFGTLEPDLNTRTFRVPTTPAGVQNGPTELYRGKISPENHNHSILVGVRYNFGQAPRPAPAAPAAAPAPARTYLVFFDWDRYNLTDRARQIIAEAAQNRTRVQVTRIEVNGYTDRSGTERYNMGLSIRRANAVAAELVRLGVPRNEIVTRGFGESNPLVPTADGVREPQNRRVEIILR